MPCTGIARIALAGRKPAAMRAHGGDKILFPLLVQWTAAAPLPFPMPTSTYYPALGSSSPHSPSSPQHRCALSFPFHHITASLSIMSPPPAFAGIGHVWVWVGQTPGGKHQRSTPKEPIADRYHESMGWGNLHYPSVENIVERVDILSAARLAIGMVGMRRAIRGTLNLPLNAPGLLHADESSWPYDSDAQVRVTRSSILLYIYIDLLSVYVLAIHRSLCRTPCMHWPFRYNISEKWSYSAHNAF
jgi:hypothetical protein